MVVRALCAALVLGAGALSVPTPLAEPVDDEAPAVEHLSFLTGDWAGSDGRSEWETVYGSTRGGHLLSATKELREGRVVSFDFEHFYEREGQVYLRPAPKGRPSVEFALVELSASRMRAVFENPDHDFPRRFVYHRAGEESLVIELTGAMGGQEIAVRLDLAPRVR